MASLKAFKAFRPQDNWVKEVAALPYDVMTDEEAKQMVLGHPYSFLNIDKPEIHIQDPGEAPYIYAGKQLKKMIKEGIFIQESEALYIYELETDKVHQYGLVGLVSTADYNKGIIKKHENTRSDKEQERVWHILNCKAHTGPIFLVEKDLEQLGSQLQAYSTAHKPLFDICFEDGVAHRIYKIDEPNLIHQFIQAFEKVPSLYIADGHHRAAAACKTAEKLGKDAAEAQDFLAVIFPKDQLQILAYHRVLKDESGYNKDELFSILSQNFDIVPVEQSTYMPTQPHVFGMRYQKQWYRLTCNKK